MSTQLHSLNQHWDVTVPIQEWVGMYLLKAMLLFLAFIWLGLQVSLLLSISVFLFLKIRVKPQRNSFLALYADGKCIETIENQSVALSLKQVIKGPFWLTLVFHEKTFVFWVFSIDNNQWRRLFVLAKSALWRKVVV